LIGTPLEKWWQHWKKYIISILNCRTLHYVQVYSYTDYINGSIHLKIRLNICVSKRKEHLLLIFESNARVNCNYKFLVELSCDKHNANLLRWRYLEAALYITYPARMVLWQMSCSIWISENRCKVSTILYLQF
jgi:hypothetical protein